MTESKATIDVEKENADFDLAKSLAGATQATGKKPLAQVSEIAKLTFGGGKLTPEEYFNFHLYDDGKFTMEDKKKFLGKKAQDVILRRINPLEWWSIPHDKLVLYGLLAGLTYAVPTTQALFHPFRRFGEVPALRSTEALAAFLRDGMRYPFFGKPVAGIHSVGVSSVTAYDADADVLVLSNGARVPVESYVAELEQFFKDGYIFQDRLVPHPALLELFGDRIATVRIVVLLTEEGPTITHCLLKVPAGDNIADNFWRQGNLLAALDVETGRILRVVQGFGIEELEIENHPDTGGRLLDFVLPDWERVKGLCLACAAAIPGLKMQAWDIAIGPQGPVMVEVNIGGDFNLPQIATRSGLNDGLFAEFLAKHMNAK
jgi:glutathione synthase/RimK-type ligase-like ATP-grasp enzyme